MHVGRECESKRDVKGEYYDSIRTVERLSLCHASESRGSGRGASRRIAFPSEWSPSGLYKCDYDYDRIS